MSSEVFSFVDNETTYDGAMAKLIKLYAKSKNIIYARHKLATRRQQPGESVPEFAEELIVLAKQCDFKAVSAEDHVAEAVRDAFISGLSSPDIRLRLLEKQRVNVG